MRHLKTSDFVLETNFPSLLFRAFADALEQIPLALAENCGLAPIQTLTAIKAQQVAENNSGLGVNCMEGG